MGGEENGLALADVSRRGDGRWDLTRLYHLPPRRLRAATGSPAEDAVFMALAVAALHLLLRALAGLA